MSEKEILNRQRYKENRKKWLLIQAVAIAVVVAVALGSFLIYDRMNRTYYIEYTENSEIDYQVYYQENKYFDDLIRGEDQTYIAHLIDHITADFQYQMNMDAANVDFDYSYSILAKLVVEDKDTGKPYYTVEELLLPCTQNTTQDNKVDIRQQVEIDFPKYNAVATEFMNAYDLSNATATLVVTLDVQMLSSCDQFEKNNENAYSTDLRIPLNELTMDIISTASAPATESKVLAYSTFINKWVPLTIAYIASGLALLQVLALVVYMHLTKNEDVTYTARVRKLLNAYSSYIQRMEGEFDDQGYQVIVIKSFNELLGIRDTLQAPILMTENKDQTKSRFLIPTDSKMLYAFEIKVDNYDEIYGAQAAPAPKGGGRGRYLR